MNWLTKVIIFCWWTDQFSSDAGNNAWKGMRGDLWEQLWWNSLQDDISTDQIKTAGYSRLAHKRLAPSTVSHSLTPFASYSEGSLTLIHTYRDTPPQRRADAESSWCVGSGTLSWLLTKLVLSAGYSIIKSCSMSKHKLFVILNTLHMMQQYIFTEDTDTWRHLFHCSISRFKLSEGHRKMSLLFCGSSQWGFFVTKPQLSVQRPSQHTSVSDSSHWPAAGPDISFQCQMACWATLSSWLTGR